MFFKQVTLTEFKNYASKNFQFNKRIVGICGLNGKGKTNLLDALYYLCFTKSYFARSDQINVRFGAEGFRIKGILLDKEKKNQTVVCVYRGNSRKEFSVNEIPYARLSEHIGKFPCVMIAPDDITLITGTSDERRKFIDSLICQIDTSYLDNLILHNRLLSQRNALLKYEALNNRRDDTLLDSIDERMISAGNLIYNKRNDFLAEIFPLVQHYYDLISGSSEEIHLAYDSQLNESNYKTLLKITLEKDRYTQRTNAGIHKDDIAFTLRSNLFRQTASQGQKKSLLFACKLAEFKILKQEKGFPPALLLDDVFEKLDDKRLKNLLTFIIEKNEGQVFITDTNEDRLRHALAGFHSELQIIQLD